MLYVRGNPKDYDEWESLGNHGWGFNSALPYFRKAEKLHIPDEQLDEDFHGKDGNLWVKHTGETAEFSKIFAKAANELGYKYGDYNGKMADEEVAFKFQVNHKHGIRADTFTSYIIDQNLLNNENLKILTQSHVTNLIIDDFKRVRGIRIQRFGQAKEFYSRKEVILSAGAIGSPKILMLSGIGPKQHLKDLGIKVVKDLEGVGSNLHDHITGFFNYKRTKGDQDLRLNVWDTLNPFEYVRYYWQRVGGALGDCSLSRGLFMKTGATSDDQFNRTDIQIHTLPTSWNHDYGFGMTKLYGLSSEQYYKMFEGQEDVHTVAVMTTLLRPKSRGTLRLSSEDPFDDPLIDPNYLSHNDDVKVIAAALKRADEFVGTQAFKQHGLVHLPDLQTCPDHPTMSDEYLECLVKAYAATLWHYVGTCKMGSGSDPMAVVDEKLRVYGLDGIRVVDGSVMPKITGGNPNAPIVMIAEKAADMIKQDWPRGSSRMTASTKDEL